MRGAEKVSSRRGENPTVSMRLIGSPPRSPRIVAFCARGLLPTLLARALAMVDHASFEEVQAAVLILILLFSFARSETPCPKSRDGFDADQHLRVCDVVPRGNPFQLRVRLKRIKQDPRLERSDLEVSRLRALRS